MDVSSTTAFATSAPASAASAGKTNQLDYDAFLKLLITEMQNQDPTEPMKSSEYVAQFAAFSNVEQAIQTNAKLDALLTSSALAQTDSVLGRTVTSPDGNLSGIVQSIRITADGLVASLDTGAELALGEGVTIS